MKWVQLCFLPALALACVHDTSPLELKQDHHTSVVTIDEVIVEGQTTCPKDMVEVEGEWCPEPVQICKKWVVTHGKTSTTQCLEFERPVKCLSKKRVHKHACVDRFEFPNVKGQLPQVFMSYTDAVKECRARGKQVINETDWIFACEGPLAVPYPYGDGYHRDSNACNMDKRYYEPSDPRSDQRAPSGQYEQCVSPFGVYDMVSNADEWVRNEVGKPQPGILMGGHWISPARNRCRAETLHHTANFAWYITSTRCEILLP